MPDPSGNNSTKFTDGIQMSKRQAQELESDLQENPNQPDKRSRLLSFYSLRIGYGGTKKALVTHLDWFINNIPEADLMMAAFAFVSKQLDAEGYEVLKASWLTQIDANPGNKSVYLNAARFFQFDDRDLAEELFLKGKSLSPDDHILTQELANFYQMGATKAGSGGDNSSDKALKQFEAGVNQAEDEIHRFYALTSLVEAAADTGHLQRAEEVAEELLKLAPNFPDDWNYGNAIFQANYALAVVALSRNEVELSGQYLLTASCTPGSPQLDSFGPKFELAQQLLVLGRRQVAKEYISNCSKFWKMDMGVCEKWTKQIESGEMTELNRFAPENFSIWKVARALTPKRNRFKTTSEANVRYDEPYAL